MRSILFAAFFLVCCAHPAMSTIHYVATNGSFFAAGTELDPFLVIQDGIDAAFSGDTVFVGPGIYGGPGNLNLTFSGKTINLASSAGSESTMIDCSDHGRAFILKAGDSTNIVIEGFTIFGANSIPTFTNGTPGSAFYHAAYGTNGSAVICYPGGGARFNSCRFIGNRADSFVIITTDIDGDTSTIVTISDGHGGAMRIIGGTVIMSNCFFAGNVAGLCGGAIAGESNATIAVFDSTFITNRTMASTDISIYTVDGDATYDIHVIGTDSSGGGVDLNISTGVFKRCLFQGNTSGSGGGVSIKTGSYMTVNDSRLTENMSVSTSPNSGGGALYVENSEACVDGSTIDKNQAGELDSSVYIETHIGDQTTEVFVRNGRSTGGGILSGESSRLIITNSILCNNTATAGGGAVSIRNPQSAFITDVLFSENRLTGRMMETNSGGGALLLRDSSSNTVIRESTFIGNEATEGNSVFIKLTSQIGDQTTVISITDKVGSSGGALCLLNTQSALLDTITLIANEATTGGGMYFEQCENILVQNITAVSNTAFNSTTVTEFDIVDSSQHIELVASSHKYGMGGALYTTGSFFSIRNGLLRGNRGSWGSALACIDSESLLTGLMIADHSAYDFFQSVSHTDTMGNDLALPTITISNTPFLGVAVAGRQADVNHLTILNTGGHITNAQMTMINTVVWSNQWEVDASAVFTSSYSCVLGTYPGDGNIMSDPLLARTGRLLTNSPCVDAAWVDPTYTNDFELEAIAGAGPDIGADELVDSDHDGLADAWELDHYDDLNEADYNSDGDFDGASNGLEQLYGSDPEVNKTNGEPIPDGWLIKHGLNPLLSQQGFDPDEDLYVTLDEYIADTDPLDPMSYLAISIAEADGSGHPSIAWYGASNRWYCVEEVSMLSGIWSLKTNTIPGSGDMIVLTESTSTNSPAPFSGFRVKARLSP